MAELREAWQQLIAGDLAVLPFFVILFLMVLGGIKDGIEALVVAGRALASWLPQVLSGLIYTLAVASRLTVLMLMLVVAAIGGMFVYIYATATRFRDIDGEYFKAIQLERYMWDCGILFRDMERLPNRINNLFNHELPKGLRLSLSRA